MFESTVMLICAFKPINRLVDKTITILIISYRPGLTAQRADGRSYVTGSIRG